MSDKENEHWVGMIIILMFIAFMLHFVLTEVAKSVTTDIIHQHYLTLNTCTR